MKIAIQGGYTAVDGGSRPAAPKSGSGVMPARKPSTFTDAHSEHRNKLILEALKEARTAIGLAATIKLLGKIDYAISLLERENDCEGIDLATEVHGERG